MGLFDNIRADILEEFNSYVADVKWDTKYSYNNFGTFHQSEKRRLNTRSTSDLVDKLERKRWGYYPVCPFCQCDKYYELNDDITYRCGNGECRYNFTVFTKTILSNTKVTINKWYDLAEAYRKDNKVSTHSFCKVIGTTQKTCWCMLAKLKTHPFINEPDVSIFNVLLSPNILHKNFAPKKMDFKQWETSTLKKLRTVHFENNYCLTILTGLIDVMKTYFNKSQLLLANELGINKRQLCKWFSGTRKPTFKMLAKLESFLYNVSMKHFERILLTA